MGSGGGVGGFRVGFGLVLGWCWMGRVDLRFCLGSVLCWVTLGNLAFKASLGWD